MEKGARKYGAATILTAMLAGLGTFTFNHFAYDYPSMKARVRVLETSNKNKSDILQEIRKDVRTLNNGQIKIYEILINNK